MTNADLLAVITALDAAGYEVMSTNGNPQYSIQPGVQVSSLNLTVTKKSTTTTTGTTTV